MGADDLKYVHEYVQLAKGPISKRLREQSARVCDMHDKLTCVIVELEHIKRELVEIKALQPEIRAQQTEIKINLSEFKASLTELKQSHHRCGNGTWNGNGNGGGAPVNSIRKLSTIPKADDDNDIVRGKVKAAFWTAIAPALMGGCVVILEIIRTLVN
jgi:hypothetical protein